MASLGLLGGVTVLVLGLLVSAGISSIKTTCRLDPIVVPYDPIDFQERHSWPDEYNIGNAEIIDVGPSPEDLAVDSKGNVYTGLNDGWIKRFDVKGNLENFTHHDGPILGLAFGPDDALYIADNDKGLFVISQDKTEKLLSNEADGIPIRLTDGVAVAKDGTVYFTDASIKFNLDDWLLDVLEGRPNGRLMKYDPSTGTTTVLATDLAFANGVALSEDEDFFLMNEFSRGRIHRYWLKGEKAGTMELFIEHLPGYPDNIRYSKQDKVFYVGLFASRDRTLEWIMKKPSKFLRCFLASRIALPLAYDTLTPGMLLTISPDAKIQTRFYDSGGHLTRRITGGIMVGRYLYISGFERNFIGRIRL